MIRGRFIHWLAVAGLILLCLAQESGAQEKVSVRLGWRIAGTYGAVFAALDKGFFRDQGLRVTIAEGQGSADTMKLVAARKDTFGFIDYGTMAPGVARGLPVKAIFGIMQTSPIAIASRAESGIKVPKDLEGKTVGGHPASSTHTLLPAVLKAGGADISRVKMVGGPAFSAPLLLARKVDAITLYTTASVPWLKHKEPGIKLNIIPYPDYGVNVLSDGIAAHVRILRERPDMVRRFIRATSKGLAYSRNNAGEVTRVMKKMFPLAKGKTLEEQLLLGLELLATPNTRGKPLGWMAAEDWRKMINLMVEYKIIDKKVPLAKLYTNEFIPQ